jgi:hypothetical protein
LLDLNFAVLGHRRYFHRPPLSGAKCHCASRASDAGCRAAALSSSSAFQNSAMVKGPASRTTVTAAARSGTSAALAPLPPHAHATRPRPSEISTREPTLTRPFADLLHVVVGRAATFPCAMRTDRWNTLPRRYSYFLAHRHGYNVHTRHGDMPLNMTCCLFKGQGAYRLCGLLPLCCGGGRRVPSWW